MARRTVTASSQRQLLCQSCTSSQPYRIHENEIDSIPYEPHKIGASPVILILFIYIVSWKGLKSQKDLITKDTLDHVYCLLLITLLIACLSGTLQVLYDGTNIGNILNRYIRKCRGINNAMPKKKHVIINGITEAVRSIVGAVKRSGQAYCSQKKRWYKDQERSECGRSRIKEKKDKKERNSQVKKKKCCKVFSFHPTSSYLVSSCSETSRSKQNIMHANKKKERRKQEERKNRKQKIKECESIITSNK